MGLKYNTAAVLFVVLQNGKLSRESNDVYTLIITYKSKEHIFFFKTGLEYNVGTSTSQKQKTFMLLIILIRKFHLTW